MRYLLVVFVLIAILLTGDKHSHNPSVYILPVKNSIKMGILAGNVNLTLGVKNILSEALADKEYQLALTQDSSDYTLQADLIYFDIMTTGSNLSVFHKSEAKTIIRIKGTLLLDGKKVKDYVATGTSSEISTSTMIIDEGGGFNQASARSALKKTIINLIDKLL